MTRTLRSPLPWVAGALVLAAAGGAATVDLTSALPAAGQSGRNGNAALPPPKTLVLSGSVTGKVKPGTPATLAVRIENPNNQPVDLRTVTATVTSVTSAGIEGLPTCDTSWFRLGSFTGTKRVAKKASTTVNLPVTFVDSPTVNQDNCKNSTYTFSFTATADQA